MSSRDISKRICCTCLCTDRKLFQLYRVPDGINLLYMLLMCDTDAYLEGFLKDTASWLVCWECRAIIKKIKQFRLQTCSALKYLRDVAEGRSKEVVLQSLSHLSTQSIPSTDIDIDIIDCMTDVKQIKKENTETSPNSFEEHKVTNNYDNKSKVTKNYEDKNKVTKKYEDKPKVTNNYDDMHSCEDEPNSNNINEDETNKDLLRKKKHKKSKNKKVDRIKKYYSVTIIDSEELKAVNDKRKSELENVLKCDSCVLGFENDRDLSTHNSELHTKKESHSLCDVCLSYIKDDALHIHTHEHYRRYVCALCVHTACTRELIVGHLKEKHTILIGNTKRQLKKSRKPDGPMKYPCSECDMTFDNKGAKWKHVQKQHRAGYTCSACHKVFSFKHNLQRHVLTHAEPPPRAECPTCHKHVRASLLRAHERTHAPRAHYACEPCARAFVCRATYEAHLKHARAHAGSDVLRHACSSCDKRFRSRAELQDHVAYRHDNQPRHNCPICDKGLATPRCVTRHVRRAHDGVPERARDQMCHHCGLAFRDKKSLTEHVARHTGARPLTCTRCGRAFRQRAALYAHARRLHADT